MIEFKIGITALIFGILSWMGIHVFDDIEWGGVATVCAIITVVCGITFIVSVVAGVWKL